MRCFALIACLAFGTIACAAACGSSSSSTPAEFDDTQMPAHPTNPDGIAYPTDNIGTRARVLKVRGDRIANYTFQGYDHANVAAGLKVFSMADFYDPQKKRYKTIAIQGAGTWCEICSSESDATHTAAPTLEQEGAVMLTVVVNGPSQGYGPALIDVDQWITAHASNNTMLIDVRGRRLSELGLTGVPWNALVDPRTMELLFASDGAPDDIVAFVREGENFYTQNPPAY